PFSRRYSSPGALRNVKRVSDARQLARFSGLQLNEAMRGRAILVLLGLTAIGGYSVGRQSAPVSNAPVPAITSPSALAQPVAFIGPAAQPSAPAPAPSVSGGPT